MHGASARKPSLTIPRLEEVARGQRRKWEGKALPGWGGGQSWTTDLRGHLQNGYFVPELALLLGGETQFVDDLYCHVPACLPVLSWAGGRGDGG